MMNVIWGKFLRSFVYASEGITYSLASQRNMKAHFTIAFIVLLLGMWFHFNTMDTLIILFAIGLVIGFEMVNTAIEATIDLVTQEFHPLAKIAKDVAAGAILMVTFTVVFVGLVVLFPYLTLIYQEGWKGRLPSQPSFFILQGFFLLLFTYVVKAYWYKKQSNYEPNVLVGNLLYLFVLFYFINVLFSLLVFFLLTNYLIMILFKKKFTWIGFVQNGLISIGGFFLLYNLFY